MTISLGSDHAGYEFKKAIHDYLLSKNYSVIDFGTNSPASVDYPDFAHPAAYAVADGNANFGVVICGSGNGVAMTVNKHPTIRCGLCWNDDVASVVRKHNDANMIAIPARFVTLESAISMVNIFLHTDFEGGRHQNRINKIPCV